MALATKGVLIVAKRWSSATGTALRVAHEVLVHGPISRAEISRRFDLTPGTVTRIAKALIDEGVLVDGHGSAGATEGRVGRPSQPLAIAPSQARFVGVKVTADDAYGVVTTLQAEQLARTQVRLPGREPRQVADAVARIVTDLDPHATAVGVTIGGDTSGGIARRAPFLGWTDVDLDSLLRARLPMPAVVANDLLALTEATHWFGEARGLDRFALITVGAGVGLGLVVHGRLVTNDDSGLGLIGHLPLDPLGTVCDEGHRGCAATLASAMIAGEVSLTYGRSVSYDEALDLANAADPAASRVVGDAARNLGRLVASVSCIALPELVVIGGEGSRIAEVASELLADTVAQYRPPQAAPVALRIQRGGFDAWARGAAVAAIKDFVGA